MDRSQIKVWATSLTALVFLVVGISGVMLFFHLGEQYVKNLHEYLGVLFVFAAFFHLFFNWKPMKRYFTKRAFQIGLVGTILVSALFVLNSSSSHSSKGALANLLLQAPLQTSSSVFHTDAKSAIESLKSANIDAREQDTIVSIAKRNQISPMEVVNVLLNKE
jgi:membrane protease YdiL (CAAX protease family)